MIARVWRRDGRALRNFAHLLEMARRRGLWLRYRDEDDATVARRIDRLNWIAREPNKAARHLSRRMRGLDRQRAAAQSAPASWTPPLLACAALAFTPMHDPRIDIDTS